MILFTICLLTYLSIFILGGIRREEGFLVIFMIGVENLDSINIFEGVYKGSN